MSLYNFLSELNNIFHVKDLKYLLFMSNRRRPNKKNIESPHLTQNNVFKALTWKDYFL